MAKLYTEYKDKYQIKLRYTVHVYITQRCINISLVQKYKY